MSRPRATPETAKAAFVREIKIRRAHYDMTQRQLADSVGVVPSVMSTLLSNPDKISAGRLRAIVAIIGNRYVSCLWAEGYNTVQKFTLELLDTPEYRRKVRPDCYVGRDDRKTLMVIKTITAEEGKLIASGFQAAQVLDDSAFVGTIAAGSVIGASIKAAYDAGSKIQLVEISESDLQDQYGSQISNKPVLNLCTTMCQSADVGFRAVRGNGQIDIQFYKPEQNPNLILSEQFGNLILRSVTLSTKNEKNYAIVLGAGEGEDRTRVDVDLTGGDSRREMIVDARDIKQEDGESADAYKERLAARGAEKLLEKRRTWKCEITPVAAEFGTRYDLGDVLTVLLTDYGMRMQTRVSKFSQKVQNNKVSTTISVGEITIMR